MMTRFDWLASLTISVVVALCLTTTGWAAERVVKITDHTGRGFPPDLVEYNLEGVKDAGAVRVYDAAGAGVPSQVRAGDAGGPAVLQLVTALPANSSVSFTIKDSGGAQPAGGVAVNADAQGIALSNQVFAIRTPPEMAKTFAPAVDASSLPAPILAFRHGANGAWLGKSAVLAARKVKALTVKVEARGSVVAQVKYQIDWDGGGFYRATVQVIDQAPLARVTEEYDLDKLDGTDFWELDLGQGWKPDRAQTASHNGNGSGDPTGRVVDFATLNKTGVQYMVGDQAWGKLSHLGVFNDTDAKATRKAYPLVGVVPLRKGLWRRSNALEVHSAGVNDIRVRFPMSARHAQWPRDITSETSPFCTLEHDPDLPPTFGRRVWGLALGHPSIPDPTGDRPTYQLQKLYGIIGLDRYKDFILDWPDTNAKYPRLYPRNTAADNPAVVIARLQQVASDYFNSTHASHHSTCAYYIHAAQAEAALMSPKLDPAGRAKLRALLALIVQVYEDADMMSYANGHHHGNPNMGTARYWSGPAFLALLPDHPRFAAWRDHMAQYGEYNLSTQVAPGGSYLEYGAAYHMHGFARATNGVMGLKASEAANFDNLIDRYFVPDWTYYLNLLTPYDSRWGSRMIPGMANSQPGNTEHFIEASGLLSSKPELAGHLAWAWKANGEPPNYNAALAAGALQPVEPKLTSAIFPGMGVIFRAHQGPQETYMLFRAGFQWSHWTVDPGHFVLYSKGACLVPSQTYQYGDSKDPAFDPQNTIRLGHPENVWPHGWGDSSILDHAFGPTVDYAWASTGFPEWFIKPGISPTWKNAAGVTTAGERKLDATPGQVEGAIEWNRQVMFLKGKTAASPNYFVFRDSMPGQGKLASYLYLNLLGMKTNVTQTGGKLTAGTEWPVKLDVEFAQPTAIQVDMHEQRFPLALHNSNVAQRIGAAGSISPNWVRADGAKWEGVPSTATHENHVILRVPSAPGEGYFWIVYPRADAEAPCKAEALAPGVMKVVHPEGTDYVFLSPTPLTFERDGVVFQGMAGAVRVRADSVTLVKSNGVGKVGYRGRVIAGAAAREQIFALGAVGTEPIAADAAAPAAGETQVAPSVFKSVDGQVTRYRVAAHTVARDGAVRLEGGPGMIEVQDRQVRFVAPVGTYAKFSVGNRGVRGVGGFDLTFTDNGIKGQVDGDTRSLIVTWPDAITRPMFRLDGVRYCAGWADDHGIGKGTDSPQFSVGLGVTSGKHTIEIAEWTYPKLPPLPARRGVSF